MVVAVTPGVAAGLGPAMYPLSRTKTVYLVRHGQGFHNVAGELDHKAYEAEEYFDASLTPQGWKQVRALRKHVEETGILAGVELVVTSPLTRTMQTASGIFGGGDIVEADARSALMAEGVGKATHPAIASAPARPFVAAEWCREHLGVHPCDKRNSITQYRNMFPAIDFSQVETDEDIWWKADVRETEEELFGRARAFLAWLLKQNQTRIAVVTHSSFLNHLVGLFGQDCSPDVRKELTAGFNNCEMRCVVVSDRMAIGSNGVVMDFPGGNSTISSTHADDSIENGHI